MGYGKREAQHLVSYPNGAVVPFNPNHHVGVYTGAYGVIPHYGKREALVHHPNGAVAPHNPALEIATAQHLASKGYGVYGVHGVFPHVYGKREAQHLVSYSNGAVVPFDPNHHVGVYTGAYGVIPHYGKREAQHLVTYPNGAVVPFDPNHHVGYAGVYPGYPYIGRKKREAAVPVNLVTGAAHVPHVVHPYFGGIGYAVAPVVSPFTLHGNGALVPKEPE